LGKAVVVREGKDLALISTGALLRTTVDAADKLAVLGIQPRVLSMHTLKPLDSESVILAARETGVVVTIEEHSIIGGLGSAVSEVLAEASETEGVRFKRIGLPSEFSPHIGSQDYLRCQHSLTAESIVDSVRSVLKTAKAVV
jgi:transketolase